MPKPYTTNYLLSRDNSVVFSVFISGSWHSDWTISSRPDNRIFDTKINMATIRIRCESCGRDLTTTNNCEDYRIALVSERIPSEEGPVTDMAISPLIETTKRFCSFYCLTNWIVHAE